MRPALIRGGEFYRGDASAAAALARDFAGEVRRVLLSEMASCEPGPLSIKRREISLPLATMPLSALTLESVRLDLARNLGLLTFNAEMVIAYGLHTKQVSRGRLLPVGYSNGMIGYVPTRLQIDEGGYESAEAFRYYGQPAAFDGAVEEIVLQHIRQFVEPGC